LRLPKFDYHKPGNIQEACSILKGHNGNARVIAGGTDLLVAMKHRVKAPAHIISLKGIKGLDTINPSSSLSNKDSIPLSPPSCLPNSGEFSSGNDTLTIGSLVTLQSVADADIIKKRFPILSAAADSVASQQIRNMGTIGGNICLDTRCWYYNQSKEWRDARPPCFKTKGSVCYVIKGGNKCNALYASDTAPALIALNARVKICNSENTSKEIPIENFFTGVGEPVNILKQDEIMTQITIPNNSSGGAETRGAFNKLCFREGLEYPVINVAVLLELNKEKICKNAKIVIGAVTSSPVRAKNAEEKLKGKKIDEALIAEAGKTASKDISVIPYLWASPGYKRKMIEVCVGRGIRKALEKD